MTPDAAPSPPAQDGGRPGGNQELMKLTEGLKQLIHRKESASTIRQAAIEEGMVSLRRDAIRKVVQGVTTPEEVFRSVYLEE